MEDGFAAPGTEETVRRLRQELSDLTPTERTLNQTLENIAYAKVQLHDVGSTAFIGACFPHRLTPLRLLMRPPSLGHRALKPPGVT